jgi:hypothetical protein
MSIPKELTEKQIETIKSVCEPHTLERLAVVEAGFADWAIASNHAKEVVRLAELLETVNEERLRLWNRI